MGVWRELRGRHHRPALPMQLPVRVGISARLGRQHSNARRQRHLQCGAGRIHPPEAAAAAAAAAVAAVAAATSSEPGSPAAAAAAAVVLPRGIVEGWSRVLLPLGRRCVLHGGGGGVRGSRDEQELEARHRRLAVCERVVIVRCGLPLLPQRPRSLLCGKPARPLRRRLLRSPRHV